MIQMNKEIIVCSAININGAIIVWKRHWDCIKSAVNSWIWKPPIKSAGQWFYTSHFRFVDRMTAMDIAIESWQAVQKQSWFLFSEDLR